MASITPSDMGIKSQTINRVLISSISWDSFQGEIPDNPPYYAHVFWNVSYTYFFQAMQNDYRIKVLPRPVVSKKSWVRVDQSSEKLLRHEYGHYLIGCLCALEFQNRVNNCHQENRFKCKSDAIKWCSQIFDQTLAEHLRMEIKYDNETDHYYNTDEQSKWQEDLVKKINSFIKVHSLSEKRKLQVNSDRSLSRNSRQTSNQDKQNRINSMNKVKINKNKFVEMRSEKNIPFVPLPNKPQKNRKYSENLVQQEFKQVNKVQLQLAENSNLNGGKGFRIRQGPRPRRNSLQKVNTGKDTSYQKQNSQFIE